MRKVLVATSAGGHWVQMRRLLPAFEGCDLVFAGVAERLDADLGPAPYARLRNVSRSDPLGFFVVAWQLARLVRRERPEVVVTTGAAPGLMALVVGKLLAGSRTVWIELDRQQRADVALRAGWPGRWPTPGWCSGRTSPGPAVPSTGGRCCDLRHRRRRAAVRPAGPGDGRLRRRASGRVVARADRRGGRLRAGAHALGAHPRARRLRRGDGRGAARRRPRRGRLGGLGRRARQADRDHAAAGPARRAPQRPPARHRRPPRRPGRGLGGRRRDRAAGADRRGARRGGGGTVAIARTALGRALPRPAARLRPAGVSLGCGRGGRASDYAVVSGLGRLGTCARRHRRDRGEPAALAVAASGSGEPVAAAASARS